ncbi:MAG: hypothetical protein GC164_12940 [Phycisphaera sp.]|nr:hypothetical protein [Phycisphaera sp.]
MSQAKWADPPESPEPPEISKLPPRSVPPVRSRGKGLGSLDVQFLARMVNEIASAQRQPADLAREVLLRLNRAIGARHSLLLLLSDAYPHGRCAVESAWEESDNSRGQTLALARAMRTIDLTRHPVFAGMLSLDGLLVTHRRGHFLQNEQWYDDPLARALDLGVGLDNPIFSWQRLPRTGYVMAMHAYRARNQPAFSNKDRLWVRLYHLAMGCCLMHCLSPELFLAGDATQSLSPRHQTVLNCLIAGDSEKQVAYRLGISQHTVHNYVKAIYKHFEVSSRAELLARFIRQPVGETPAPIKFTPTTV